MKKTPQQWDDIFEQQKNGSLSVQEFCQQEKISSSNFYKHKKLAATKGRFALVNRAPAIQEPTQEAINDSNSRISLTTDAGHLSLPASTSADFLVQLVRGLS